MDELVFEVCKSHSELSVLRFSRSFLIFQKVSEKKKLN